MRHLMSINCQVWLRGPSSLPLGHFKGLEAYYPGARDKGQTSLVRPDSVLYIPSLQHFRSGASFLVACPPLVVDSWSSDCDRLRNGVAKSQVLDSDCLG